MGGKVLVPTFEFIHKLTAARLAADVAGRADRSGRAHGCRLPPSCSRAISIKRDKPFCTGERTEEGFFQVRAGIDLAIDAGAGLRALRRFGLVRNKQAGSRLRAEIRGGVEGQIPRRMLAYNCSPSFNWKENLDDTTIANFQNELGAMGYKFQFVTLAGFHAFNLAMWELARGYKDRQMAAYTELQEEEFKAELDGYKAAKHQSFVGAGYFDQISQICGESSTVALKDSTEEEQFHEEMIHHRS